MRRALLLVLVVAGLATADDKTPHKLTAENLDKPGSGSEQKRWLEELRKNVHGKPVQVTGTLYYLKDRKNAGQVHLDDSKSVLRVYLKGEPPAGLIQKEVTVTGTGRVEAYPVEVWIDKPDFDGNKADPAPADPKQPDPQPMPQRRRPRTTPRPPT